MRLATTACVALALLIASDALAQQVDSRGIPYRPWDLNASVGLHISDTRDAGAPDNGGFDEGTNGTGAFGLDVGRYWNSHLKTEVGVMIRPDWTSYGQPPARTPGGVSGYAWTRTRIAQTQLSLGGTWQFLENTFAHPYLTAGARLGIVRAHEVTEGSVWVYDGRTSTAYPVEPSERRSTRLLMRPYVAGGFKSYFNERVFVRPEIATAFNSDGASQWTFRVGFGVDF